MGRKAFLKCINHASNEIALDPFSMRWLKRSLVASSRHTGLPDPVSRGLMDDSNGPESHGDSTKSSILFRRQCLDHIRARIPCCTYVVEHIETEVWEITAYKAARQQGNKAPRSSYISMACHISKPLGARDSVADEISLASCLITQKSCRIFLNQVTRAPPSLTLLYLKFTVLHRLRFVLGSFCYRRRRFCCDSTPL